MRLVIDASIALSWCFRDQGTIEMKALNKRVAADGAVVPALWHIEIADSLVQSERRGRISQTDVIASLAMFGALLIETDYESIDRAWRETLLLARTHRLTVYDACYLELALRRGLPLATLDKDLATAGRELG